MTQKFSRLNKKARNFKWLKKSLFFIVPLLLWGCRQNTSDSKIAALLAAHEDYLKNETIAVAVVPSPTPLAGPPRLLGMSEAGAPLALRLKVSTVFPEKSEG